ncbi:winged helix-turn-helix domain-containing protein [Mesorhizobium sp. AR07]|uniref:winged helix-turn-helix domain-containing protein n=1 Tax=Mesorhizobium sp. AR07 TaxID=2865838 RepID=UPI002160342B|nr:winged helix-turn-helix domain-containing protein [Mesorhizobium sp. AR07]UVK43365.1 winged helix-turn-helix domain-containing protein [Mesorhizobium sp. AR07]
MSVESMATDPYEVVLNDLRAKKAQIEQAISAIEAIRGGMSSAATSMASPAPSASQNADIDSPGAFLGMSIVDAAKKLLAAKRQPLRNPDIAAAFKRGGLAMNSKDAVNTIGSILTRRANDVGDLVKVDRGTWGLKEWYPNRSFKKGNGEPREPVKGAEELVNSEAASPAVGASTIVASVPFMITNAMREKLRSFGASEDDIKNMTPEEARSYIETFDLDP